MYCVYRLLNKEGQVLYIGQSTNLKNRLNDHFKGYYKPTKIIKNEISEVEFILLESKADMDIMEIYYINLYKPKLNTLSKCKTTIQFIPSKNYKWFKYNKEFINVLELVNISEEDLKTYGYKIFENCVYNCFGETRFGLFYSWDFFKYYTEKLEDLNIFILNRFKEVLEDDLYIFKQVNKNTKFKLYALTTKPNEEIKLHMFGFVPDFVDKNTLIEHANLSNTKNLKLIEIDELNSSEKGYISSILENLELGFLRKVGFFSSSTYEDLKYFDYLERIPRIIDQAYKNEK